MWRSLGLKTEQLSCEMTLINGQCFTWKRKAHEKEWTGVIGHRVISLKQAPDDTLYREEIGNTPRDQLEPLLLEYLNVTPQLSLPHMYAQWGKQDKRFKEIASHLPGLRLLRQDPLECMFSFLCSSNNNISRITSMLQSLRSKYGDFLGDVAGEKYFSFPRLDQLGKIQEDELRKLGFGYRAKFLVETAKLLKEKGGEEWLLGLRLLPRQDVQKELTAFCGVGRKVADCVALFSLDQLECIPVDTHVWQIACRDYSDHFPAKMEVKSMTTKVYEMVGDFFRSHFGSFAGWAHSVLFAADLPMFRPNLPAHLQPVPSPKKKRKVTEKPTTPVPLEWACASCTFLNNMEDAHCDMCDMEKPSPEADEGPAVGVAVTDTQGKPTAKPERTVKPKSKFKSANSNTKKKGGAKATVNDHDSQQVLEPEKKVIAKKVTRKVTNQTTKRSAPLKFDDAENGEATRDEQVSLPANQRKKATKRKTADA